MTKRSYGRVAAFAVVAVIGATCLGLAWSSSGTGDRSTATIAITGHHHSSASLHLEGVAAIVAVVLAAQLWATERVMRVRAYVPAATRLARRRGPPHLSA